LSTSKRKVLFAEFIIASSQRITFGAKLYSECKPDAALTAQNVRDTLGVAGSDQVF
jgi:hypothetical protein